MGRRCPIQDPPAPGSRPCRDPPGKNGTWLPEMAEGECSEMIQISQGQRRRHRQTMMDGGQVDTGGWQLQDEK